MAFHLLSPKNATAAALGILLTLLYWLYRALLPKPIEGISYNADSTTRILGDMPEMMRYVLRTKRVFVSDSATTAAWSFRDILTRVLLHDVR